MGLFGAKKEILVASTVYNMAGEVAERPDYLKTLVAGNVISNTKFSMPETLNSGYMNGPGIKLRSFHRWALNNYSGVGVPVAEMLNTQEFDRTAIETELYATIPPPAGCAYQVTTATIKRYDLEFFAEQHILANYPGRFDMAWVVDINPDLVSATITWPVDLGVSPTTFTVPADNGALYFYVTYQVTQSTPPGVWSLMWIYEIGSGNAVMDNIPQVSVPSGAFIPFIPVRLDGEFLSDVYMPSTYGLAKRAYKKLTGQKISKLIDQINENDDLDDIDHAFIVQGVALNSYDNESKKYLFKFFEYLMPYSQHGITDFNRWEEKLTTYTVTKFTYNGAYESYEGDADAQYNYIAANEAPYYPSDRPLTSISIRAMGLASTAKLWFVIKWSGIAKFTGSGLKKPDAKTGDLWWTIGSSYTAEPGQIAISPSRLVEVEGEDNTIVELHWQVSDTHWETIQLANLRHENKIYSNKSIEISAKEALTDIEESGFIVPIHYETLKSMSLVESTQMAITSSYLVLNSYKVVKQKWYATSFFKILVMVVIIAVSIAIPPAGAVGAGVLGTAAGVGAALGFSGLMAVIVGAVANAIAAMIITQLLTKVSTIVFGEKFGMIIAAVASVIAMNVGTALSTGSSMAQAWGSLMSASNIMTMTSAVGNGIQGYLQAATAEFGQKTQDLLEQYDKDSKNITQMYLDQFGYGAFAFDATRLTDTILSGNFENEATFLSRTLMTGSDIADMSLNMLTNFADMTLSLDAIGS